ncbi:MAG: dTDP-4-dehydrorhamnose reductase [Acidobacteriota bacterium]|nr:dTDP-4-dehydrorhamnose reductase [Acidobacteriota bacterium]
MRILLTGALGQLGSDLLPLLQRQGETVAVDRTECDLSSPAAIRRLVAESAPDVIVNPAAYTAVNEAEAQPALAHAINATAAGVLAEEACKRGAMFVHYSTDYVFDGRKTGEYVEADQPNPLNVYGASKLAGEQAVAAAGGRYLILRTSWVYGANGNNFLLTMRRLAREREELKIVDDQVGGPTSSIQLAQATDRLVREQAGKAPSEFPAGLYHTTAAGRVSWCGFARAIVESFRGSRVLPDSGLMKVRNIAGISSREYPTPAARPHNSVLSNRKFESAFGFCLHDWQDALAEVMREIERRES